MTNLNPVLRELPFDRLYITGLTLPSILETDAFSGINTSFIGRSMESSYHAAKMQNGK